MPVGPGRFEGEPASTFLLWTWSLDGTDEESGDVSGESGHSGLWSGCMRGSFDVFGDPEAYQAARDEGYTETELAEAAETLLAAVGAIVQTDDRGFISGSVYTTLEALESDWARILEEDAGPEPGDYTMSPSGPLGARTSVGIVDGRFLGEFASDDVSTGEAKAALAIVEDMERTKSWPNVWYISDHGNVSPVEDLHGLAEWAIVEDVTDDDLEDVDDYLPSEDDEEDLKV